MLQQEARDRGLSESEGKSRLRLLRFLQAHDKKAETKRVQEEKADRKAVRAAARAQQIDPEEEEEEGEEMEEGVEGLEEDEGDE